MNSIIQWNMTSYQSNFEELKIIIQEMNYPACLCLQETRQGDRLLRPPAGYKIIQSQQRREDESERGVCMLINKKIHHEELPLRLSGNVEAVAAKLWLGRYHTVCSLYLSPSQVIQETDITNLIDLF